MRRPARRSWLAVGSERVRVRPAQRVTLAGAVHLGRGIGVPDPQLTFRILFPKHVRAAPAVRSGFVHGADGGLPTWGRDQESR